MKHPYGHGLKIAPQGLVPKSKWVANRVWRSGVHYMLRPLDPLVLNRMRVMRVIWVKDRIGQDIARYEVMHAAQRVDIATNGDTDFLNACPNYGGGFVELPESFVCEISGAHYYPELGLVANESFEVFGDSVLLPHRFHLSLAYRKFKPTKVVHRTDVVSSIQRIDAYNFWHWMADCLPQVFLLEKFMRGEPLTLLASEELGGFQRETLELVLPRNMRVQYVPTRTWIKAERFILPSYVSGRCNGYLPEDYYTEIRKRITAGLGLADEDGPPVRIYLSRAGATRRRVANEPAVIALLKRYGFIDVRAEELSIRDQVRLFRRAEVLAAPHGAALGGMVFAPRAKILAFYPERHPGEYFYTMARRMGLAHHGIVQDADVEEDLVGEFAIDLERLESLLKNTLGPSHPPSETTGVNEFQPGQRSAGPL